MNSRRNFLKVAGTGVIAAAATPVIGSSITPLSLNKKKEQAPAESHLFKIGMAGYTFREFDIDKTIEIMKKVGVSNLSLKDFHLPMNSSQEKINEVIGKFKNAGINVYALGVIYMKTDDSVTQAFEYARMAGVRLIIGAPNYELLPLVEQKVKETGIRIAIHNHGPDNPLYPNATDIWNHIKNLDPGLGICIDIGHTLRDGADPSVDIEKYKTRIYDVHIKDVDKAAKEGKTVEMGRGLIDIPKVVTTLRNIRYSGMCSLEYEKDMKDSVPGIAESIGYFRGVMACR